MTTSDFYPGEISNLNPNRFEGISYFEQFDKEEVQAFESGTVGQSGWQRSEYYPRTAQFRFLKRDDRRILRWEFNTRADSLWAPNGSPHEEDYDVINSEIIKMAEHSIECPLPKGYGYPEIDSILFRMYSQRPVDAEALIPGKFYISESERKTQAFKYKSGAYDRSWRGLYRVFGEASEELGGVPGVELYGRHMKNQPAYKIGESEVIDVKHTDPDSGEVHMDLICYEITDEEAQTIGSLLPVKYDPLIGSEMTREEFCIYVALEGLQYTRWGKYESEGRFSSSEEVNFENYAKALDSIIERFGTEEFGEETERMIMRHLKGLHTQLHLPNSPYKPHSDIGPLSSDFMQVSKDVINDTHPLTKNMTESGHIVNALSIFGDADFWRHMGNKYPDLFDRFVNYIQDLPKDFIQKGTYATAQVDPVGLIQKYFPDAYNEIAVLRPDFYSDTEEPIKILESL